MKTVMILAYLIMFIAPAPWGIVLNSQTKECGEYWGGDEYFSYALSDRWKEYYPDNEGLVHTEVGSCNYYEGAENCCRQLGYTYIPGNIGEERGYKVPSLYAIILFCFQIWPLYLLLLAIIIVIYFDKRKKKSQTGDYEQDK
jgi:hypothetical protein